MNQAAKTRKIFDGRYEILSIVGRGACSVVYHARHVSSPSSSVALKVLLESKGRNPSAERLRREALAMVSCRHKYVARLDDFHSVGSLCYLSMEYCPESDLRAYIRKHNNRLEPVQAERFLKQSAEGLSFIHRAGIIHRDIKPENILVASDKEIRITDFGVALLPGEQCSISDLQSGVGTMNYMAPEILEGQVTNQRSDIYALGIVFYEALCGVNPFEDVHLADQIEARRDGNIPPIRSLVPAVPAHLSAVLERAIRNTPSERYQSAEELLKDLLDKKSAAYGKHARSKRVIRAESPENKKVTEKAEINNQEGTDQIEAKQAYEEERSTVFHQSPSAQAEDKEEVRIEIGQPTQTVVTTDNIQAGVQATILSEAPVEQAQAAGEPVPIFANEVPANDIQSTLEKSPAEWHEETQEIVHNRRRSSSISKETIEKIRANYLPQQNQVPVKKSGFDIPSLTLLLVSVLLFLAVFLPGFREHLNKLSMKYLKVDVAASLNFLKESDPPALPVFTAADFTFPALPDGVYTGQIKDVLPGRTSPLLLLSFASQDKLVVILNVEGWTPVVIHPSELQADGNAPKPLRVASNGIIVDLTAQNVDGELFGYFRNVITGVQGEWNAKPLRQQIKIMSSNKA